MKNCKLPAIIEIQPNEKFLAGAKVYIERDNITEPHFNLVLKDGTSFKIKLEKAEYIEPIPRKLTINEIKILISYFHKTEIPDYPNDIMHVVSGKNYWHECICLWNNETVEYKEYYKDKKLPNYQKIENEDDIEMPNYLELS